jgi:hypothetical protein
MPLIKCSDCGKRISPSEPACPHCGRPQLPSTDAAPTAARKKVPPALVAVVIVVAGIWVLSVVRNYTPPSAAQSSSPQPNPANVGIRDLIRQQHMKCESVSEVRPAETGQDVVICDDQGDEYVYKITRSANSPVVAMIDYHSGTFAPQPASSVSADTVKQAATRTQEAATSLIEAAPASQYTMRLSHAPKDNADVMAERAADDPTPDASMMEFIDDVRRNHEYQWQDAFSESIYSTNRQDATKIVVPLEYALHMNSPDGMRIVQLLANAVLRANLRCSSIYTLDSLRAEHGWRLLCDHRQEIYEIKLVGQDWKLRVQ